MRTTGIVIHQGQCVGIAMPCCVAYISSLFTLNTALNKVLSLTVLGNRKQSGRLCPKQCDIPHIALHAGTIVWLVLLHRTLLFSLNLFIPQLLF